MCVHIRYVCTHARKSEWYSSNCIYAGECFGYLRVDTYVGVHVCACLIYVYVYIHVCTHTRKSERYISNCNYVGECFSYLRVDVYVGVHVCTHST